MPCPQLAAGSGCVHASGAPVTLPSPLAAPARGVAPAGLLPRARALGLGGRVRGAAGPRVDEPVRPEPPDGPWRETEVEIRARKDAHRRATGTRCPHSCAPLPVPQDRLAQIAPQTVLGTGQLRVSRGTRAGGRAAAAAVGDVGHHPQAAAPTSHQLSRPTRTSDFGEGFEAALSTASWNLGAAGRGDTSAAARPWESAGDQTVTRRCPRPTRDLVRLRAKVASPLGAGARPQDGEALPDCLGGPDPIGSHPGALESLDRRSLAVGQRCGRRRSGGSKPPLLERPLGTRTRTRPSPPPPARPVRPERTRTLPTALGPAEPVRRGTPEAGSQRERSTRRWSAGPGSRGRSHSR